jgi:hypothetical protein
MKKTLLVFAATLLTASLYGRQSGEPRQDAPAALQKIFSNLGKSPNVYSSGGWDVFGPNNILSPGFTEMIALPFTPTQDSHVSQLRAGFIWISGSDQVNLNLYSDADGVPGTALATVTVTHVSTTCCTQLAIGNLANTVAVTAGTQYWIVANTPASGTGSDFHGLWGFAYSKLGVAFDEGTGWSTQGSNDEPAGAAYGTVP